jgi:hypothetical protein
LPKAAVESGAMVPVAIAPDGGRPRRAEREGVIEIAFGCGTRVRLRGEVSSETLRQGFDTRPLGEETERRQRRRAGAVLVGNNAETEMANLAEIEALFFALVGGSPGAEVVFLNQNLAVRSAAVLRDFYAHFLGTLPHRLLDLIDQARDPLRPVNLNDDVFGGVGASADPARGSGPARSVQHMLDRMSGSSDE